MKHRLERDVREAGRSTPELRADTDAHRSGQMAAELGADVDVRAIPEYLALT